MPKCYTWVITSKSITMENLPQQHQPGEFLEISPEALEVANCYLQTQDCRQVADELQMPVEIVTQFLQRREVKSYIDTVFMDLGFNNRIKMRRAMDALIQQKFQQMEEAGVGSNKDIADLLALSHKMAMEHLDKQIQLEKIRVGEVKTQTNIQINNEGITDSSKYGQLIAKLLESQ